MVPIECVGRIVHDPRGHYQNWGVRVHAAEGGGYLILLFHDPTDPDSGGYDNWALDQDDLEAFFTHMRWTIEWQNPD